MKKFSFFFLFLSFLNLSVILGNSYLKTYYNETLPFQDQNNGIEYVNFQWTCLENTSTSIHPEAITIVNIHGYAHRMETFDPITDYIFTNTSDNLSYYVKRVCSINLIGHEGSGVPTYKKFGEIGLTDYVEGVKSVLNFMSDTNTQGGLGFENLVLLGHSMGGLINLMILEDIAAYNDVLGIVDESQYYTLDENYNVKAIGLIAPLMPESVPGEFQWTLGDIALPSGVHPLEALVVPFLKRSRQLGTYVDLPYNMWVFDFYLDATTKKMSSIIPTNDEYNVLSNIEPLQATNEFLGNDSDKKRPIIRGDVYKYISTNSDNSQKLFTFAMKGDTWLIPSELGDMHNYLGGKSNNCITIEGADPVHDGLYIHPDNFHCALHNLIETNFDELSAINCNLLCN